MQNFRRSFPSTSPRRKFVFAVCASDALYFLRVLPERLPFWWGVDRKVLCSPKAKKILLARVKQRQFCSPGMRDFENHFYRQRHSIGDHTALSSEKLIDDDEDPARRTAWTDDEHVRSHTGHVAAIRHRMTQTMSDPVARLPETPARVLTSDAEALAVATNLAADFAEGASERDRHRRLPWAELDRFSQSGLWSMNVPEAYGGPGLSYVTVARVFAIIASGDASIAQIAQNHISLIDVVRLDPDESRKRNLLADALRGLRFGNALSERGGKHILDMQTRIVAEGDGYVISGQKFYATGALFAHLVPVHAVNDEGKSVLAFVDRRAQGLTIVDDWSAIGQRTTASGTVTLDKVRVAADRVVPAYLAYENPTAHGAIAQIIHAGIDAGIAQRAIAETIAFVRDHSRPWCDSGQERASDDPFTLREIADLKVKLHAAEAVLDRAGRIIDETLQDETEDSIAHASVAVAEAKVLTTEIAVQATNKLFELAGTRSVLQSLNLDRHWRDARVHTLHDPVRWKFHAIGNHVVNGIKPPRHSWI